MMEKKKKKKLWKFGHENQKSDFSLENLSF